MTARRRYIALACALAFAMLVTVGCAPHRASPAARSTGFAGLPVYPNATVVGSYAEALAMYRSADSYRAVVDWYVAHMPKDTHTSRNDANSQATFAVFSPAETKTVHIEVSDGTVRITITDMKLGPQPAPTGR